MVSWVLPCRPQTNMPRWGQWVWRSRSPGVQLGPSFTSCVVAGGLLDVPGPWSLISKMATIPYWFLVHHGWLWQEVMHLKVYRIGDMLIYSCEVGCYWPRNMWAGDWGHFKGVILYGTFVQNVAESRRIWLHQSCCGISVVEVNIRST